MKMKWWLLILFLLISVDGIHARTLALGAKAFYSGVYSESLANVFKLDTVNSAYGFVVNADLFLAKKFSLGGLVARSFVGSYQQFYTGYGATMKFWSRNHYWNLGATYYMKDTSQFDNTSAPNDLLLGQFSLGLYGGQGINWVFEIPVQAGMELNSQIFYGDIGIQGGLLFNI